jgi:hypothetical protein
MPPKSDRPPFLHIVEEEAPAPKPSASNPDAEMKRLAKRMLWLRRELRTVEEKLFTHRRRKANERGLIPPLSIDELISELGIAR